MKECCPLCKSKVSILRVLFVEHVTSSKETMDLYVKGKLTFENWINELDEEMVVHKQKKKEIKN